jgi:hypothetical protein
VRIAEDSVPEDVSVFENLKVRVQSAAGIVQINVSLFIETAELTLAKVVDITGGLEGGIGLQKFS